MNIQINSNALTIMPSESLNAIFPEIKEVIDAIIKINLNSITVEEEAWHKWI